MYLKKGMWCEYPYHAWSVKASSHVWATNEEAHSYSQCCCKNREKGNKKLTVTSSFQDMQLCIHFLGAKVGNCVIWNELALRKQLNKTCGECKLQTPKPKPFNCNANDEMMRTTLLPTLNSLDHIITSIISQNIINLSASIISAG